MIATGALFSPVPDLRPHGSAGTSTTRAESDRSYLYPHAWPPGRDSVSPQQAVAPPQATAGMAGRGRPASDNGNGGVRPIIGDELRLPAVWCQLGSCISRFSDTAALGESDIRSRAIAAGWRQDAVGRLACPGCVQHEPTFWITYPVVPWPLADAGPVAAPAEESRPEPENPAWAGLALPQLSLAMTPDQDGRRSGWFRRRDSGRHRQIL